MKAFQHPTYKALAELGKAIKTIFLCRYTGISSGVNQYHTKQRALWPRC
ncbi:Tn3 family transposase [Escherichia coli]|nr:Tn3 family transposase [Salmonella enterica subsp. enterica serovar Senftenberg]EKC2282246.1 Tn3 family transposase [Salmonella enterica]MBB6749470.1 Tn3 family transposase [Escherichia coli]EKC2356375.1 Tn3 family transposase [Salmonella enterica]EKC2383949.1 Tn3 family transposase [Salmonella enterica]